MLGQHVMTVAEARRIIAKWESAPESSKEALGLETLAGWLSLLSEARSALIAAGEIDPPERAR
jgi:hypothetical protein